MTALAQGASLREIGTKLGLSFTASLVALIVFGKLFGFIGILFAIPFAAVLKIFKSDILAVYQNSQFYRGSGKTAA